MNTLLIDIETSPNLCWSFSLRNAFISWDSIVEPSRTLCFAAKWLEEGPTYFYAEWKQGRREMLLQLRELLHKADVVIHFNGQKFDERRINGELWQEGLMPHSPFQRIDLWKVISRRFDLPSSKLAYVLKAVNLPNKIDSGGIQLWIRVMAGEAWAQEKFERYNIQDVDAMVPLYYTLLPWIDDHPNLNNFTESDELCCTNCGGVNLGKEGFARTKQSTFQRYRCKDCGTWMQDTRSISRATVRQVAF